MSKLQRKLLEDIKDVIYLDKEETIVGKIKVLIESYERSQGCITTKHIQRETNIGGKDEL